MSMGVRLHAYKGIDGNSMCKNSLRNLVRTVISTSDRWRNQGYRIN